MAILNATTTQIGQEGVFPKIIYVLTNDTLAEVTTAGYLNGLIKMNISLSESDMALVTTKTAPNAALTSVGWFAVTKTGANWSLTAPTQAGDVVLPTIANHIATYTNTIGTLSEDPATAISGGNIQAGLSGTAGTLASFPATASTGSLVLVAAANAGNTVTQITNASQAAARTYTLPDGGANSNFLLTNSAGTQTIATGSLALTAGNITATAGNIVAVAGNITATVGIMHAGGAISSDATVTAGTGITATTGNIVATAGNVTAGSSGNAGIVTSFPATATTGSLQLVAAANGGNTVTAITNASMGQATTLTIPDPGAASAQFLLNAGAANLISTQQFVGIKDVILISTGTWTITRIGQGNYAYVHSAAAETSIIGIDITPYIRTTANKGYYLTSFDVIYSIGTVDMTAHTVTLQTISYANNLPVSVTADTITGSLATATQANPYVSNIVLSAPAFLNVSDSKYVVEVTTQNAATTAYDFYGINLYFGQTIA